MMYPAVSSRDCDTVSSLKKNGVTANRAAKGPPPPAVASKRCPTETNRPL